jgi:hypothetical protein
MAPNCTDGFIYVSVGYEPPLRWKNEKEDVMKSTFKIMGIIAMAVIIGFSMTGCPNDDEGSNGHKHKWSKETVWVAPTETTDGIQGYQCTDCKEFQEGSNVYPSWNHLYGTWKNTTNSETLEISATTYASNILEGTYEGKITWESGFTFEAVTNANDAGKANYPRGYEIKGKVATSTNASSSVKAGASMTVRLLFDKTNRNKISYGGAIVPSFIYEKQP